MPVSLTPLLAAAAAFFVFLLSRDPIISLITGFVSWRALNALAMASKQSTSSADIRNPLPQSRTTTSRQARPTANPNQTTNDGPSWLTNWVKKVETEMEKRNSSQQSSDNDGPPLLTDIFKFRRDNHTTANETPDKRRGDDEDYEFNKRREANENAPVPKRAPAIATPQQSHNEDMHTMPEYMTRLTLLDQSISLGEISDAEYDILYDKILASAN